MRAVVLCVLLAGCASQGVVTIPEPSLPITHRVAVAVDPALTQHGGIPLRTDNQCGSILKQAEEAVAALGSCHSKLDAIGKLR